MAAYPAPATICSFCPLPVKLPAMNSQCGHLLAHAQCLKKQRRDFVEACFARVDGYAFMPQHAFRLRCQQCNHVNHVVDWVKLLPAPAWMRLRGSLVRVPDE